MEGDHGMTIKMNDRRWCTECGIDVAYHAKVEPGKITHPEACYLMQHQVEAMPWLPPADQLPYPMNWQAWVEYVREWDANPHVVMDVPNGIHPRTGEPPRVHKADSATGRPECGSGDGSLVGPYKRTGDAVTCPWCKTDWPRDAHREAWAQGPI